MMQIDEEKMQLAKSIVEQCQYSFLSKEDIENNFRDYGFLVNQNKNWNIKYFIVYLEE